MSSPVPPYGTAIHDAIASGDINRMRKVAADAEAYIRQHGDLGQSLKALQQEIAQLAGSARSGAADMVPYGDPMRAAVVSGDVDRMKHMIQIAEAWLSRVSDVQSALVDLKVEVAKRTAAR